MKVTDVRFFGEEKEGTRLKAKCSITLDESLVIHNVRVIEGEKGLFVAMPSIKKKDGSFADIVHPINPETRETIQGAVLEAYKNI